MKNHGTNVRKGYTLLEIMVSVTLMLLIMLGVSQLFSSVGTSINNTQSTLGMVANLRGAKIRLEKDLSMLTVDLTRTPPVSSGTNSGYFCVMEGMGANHDNAFLKTEDENNRSISTPHIAANEDSEDAQSIGYDTTVGDLDDVIMFTARAPEGEPFRGLVHGNVSESNTAEVVWFCRGNTLYRRVLLIIPREELNSQGLSANEAQGKEFYKRYDVSVHFVRDGNNPRAVANTLEDLQLRQYRFAHVCGFDSNNDSIQGTFPFNIHKNAACYYLRMPTLTEMSHENWNASKSFSWNLANAKRTSDNDSPVTGAPNLIYDKSVLDQGESGNTMASDLPKDGNSPFIDYWKSPFPWSDLTASGERISTIDPQLGVIDALKGARVAEDVILTNVISFDVQVWDEVANRFISLGEGTYNANGNGNPKWEIAGGSPLSSETSFLGSQGLYPLLKTTSNRRTQTAKKATGSNAALNQTRLPCVYDTWSGEYERPGYSWPDQNNNSQSTQGLNQYDDEVDGNANGIIDDADEWTIPAPYPVPLRGIKVTIRTFDPHSRGVREMTIVRDFSMGRQ